MSFGAGAIEGGIHFDISEFAHGMLEAEAISSVFPPIVVEFLEHPLLAFGELAKETFEHVSELIEGVAGHFHQMGLEAMKAGVDPQTFSTLAAAAQASGVSVEGLGNAFKFLEDRASTALRGDQEGLKAFADIGIKTRELKELLKDPEELFYRVADALHSMDDQGLRVRSSMELMSRAGVDMLPFLQKGREGVQQLAAKMGDLGGGVSEAQAEMGEKWGLIEAEISAAWNGIKVAVAQPILDAFSDHLTQIQSVVGDVAHFIQSGITAAIKEMYAIITDNKATIDGFGGSMKELISSGIKELGPILKDLIRDFTKLTIELLPAVEKGANVLLTVVEAIAKAVRFIVEGWQRLFDMNSDIAGAELGPGTRFNGGILGERTKQLIRDGTVGQPTVKVDANIHLDPAAATSQIAAKLRPAVTRGMNTLQSRLQAEARHGLATRRNGGRH